MTIASLDNQNTPICILFGVFIYFIIHHFTPPWFVPALLVRSLLFLRERILVIMFFVKQQLFLNKKIHIYNLENFNPIVFGWLNKKCDCGGRTKSLKSINHPHSLLLGRQYDMTKWYFISQPSLYFSHQTFLVSLNLKVTNNLKCQHGSNITNRCHILMMHIPTRSANAKEDISALMF